MAQRNVTTSGISNLTAGFTISGLQTTIANLKASMQAGKPILASDMGSFIPNIINPMAGHNHSVSDRQGIDSFGNVTTYGTTGQDVTKTSSVASPVWNTATVVPFTTNNPITHDDVNYIRGLVDGMTSHLHTIDDTKGAMDATPVLSTGTIGYSSNGADADGYTYLLFQNNGTLIWNYSYNVIGTGTNGSTSEVPRAGQWINMNPVDVATAASYDIKLTVTSQTGPFSWYAGSMALDTWHNLSSTRLIGLQLTWAGDAVNASVTFNIQIRQASTGTVMVDTNLTMTGALNHYEAP